MYRYSVAKSGSLPMSKIIVVAAPLTPRPCCAALNLDILPKLFSEVFGRLSLAMCSEGRNATWNRFSVTGSMSKLSCNIDSIQCSFSSSRFDHLSLGGFLYHQRKHASPAGHVLCQAASYMLRTKDSTWMESRSSAEKLRILRCSVMIHQRPHKAMR